MKHFNNDGCNKQPDYDYTLFHHYCEDNNDNYDKPIGGLHIEDWERIDYETTIKHFSDD